MPEGYLVKSNISAEEIFNELQAVANKGDILFVTKVDAESCACQIHQLKNGSQSNFHNHHGVTLKPRLMHMNTKGH